jgi:hypothetical protein
MHTATLHRQTAQPATAVSRPPLPSDPGARRRLVCRADAEPTAGSVDTPCRGAAARANRVYDVGASVLAGCSGRLIGPLPVARAVEPEAAAEQ